MWKQRVKSFCEECAIRPSTTDDAQLKLSARPATEQPPHLRTHRNNKSTQNQKNTTQAQQQPIQTIPQRPQRIPEEPAEPRAGATAVRSQPTLRTKPKLGAAQPWKRGAEPTGAGAHAPTANSNPPRQHAICDAEGPRKATSNGPEAPPRTRDAPKTRGTQGPNRRLPTTSEATTSGTDDNRVQRHSAHAGTKFHKTA